MFVKSLLAAAAISGALVVGSVGAAQADPHVTFGFGIGVGDPSWGGEGFYDGEPYWRHHHEWHRWHRWEDTPDPFVSYGISCADGRAIVASSGFHGVSAIGCGGPSFRYIGWRHGEQFRVCVNRRGNIISVNPVY